MLLALLALVHYGYDFFPRRHETALAFLGLLSVVLLWPLRRAGGRLLWCVCVFGIWEGAQVFVCQLAANWARVDAHRFSGVCDSYSGLPLYGWGLVSLVFLAAFIHDKKEHDGPD